MIHAWSIPGSSSSVSTIDKLLSTHIPESLSTEIYKKCALWSFMPTRYTNAEILNLFLQYTKQTSKQLKAISGTYF